MLLPRGEDGEAQYTEGDLQRTTGLTIVVGAVIAPILAIQFLLARGVPPAAALMNPSVWIMPLFAAGGFISAVSRNWLWRWAQVLLFVVLAWMNAKTSAYDDLTSSLYFGLALAHAAAYGFLVPKVRTFFLPAGVLFLGIRAYIAFARHETGGPFAFGLMLLSNAMLLTVFYALTRYAFQLHVERHRELEDLVASRTNALRAALAQAEALRDRNSVLLKEVHHRTKNNLQLMASLLSLQGDTRGARGRDLETVLKKVEARIQTIAKTHEVFHQSDVSSDVEIGTFVRELTDTISPAVGAGYVLFEETGLTGTRVSIDFAVPFGLVIHELVANAFEHAYPNRHAGTVWVRLTRRLNTLMLSVQDQGTGVPASVAIDKPTTTGLQIVQALLLQMDGHLELGGQPRSLWIASVRLPGPLH